MADLAARLAALRPRDVPLTCEALRAIVRAEGSLRGDPGVLASAPTGPVARAAEDPLRVAWAVRRAGSLLPGRGRCLTQSLALRQMLHERGHTAPLQIGIKRQGEGFAAHAWVEYAGRPLAERAALSEFSVARPALPRYRLGGEVVVSDTPIRGALPAAPEAAGTLRFRIAHCAPPDGLWTRVAAGPAAEWDGEPVWEIASQEGELRIVLASRAAFVLSADGATLTAYPAEPFGIPGALQELVGAVLAILLMQRGRAALHASSVAVDDRVVAFLGHSGAGKSTLARALAESGVPVFCDDMLAVEVRSGRPWALPTTATQKLDPAGPVGTGGGEPVPLSRGKLFEHPPLAAGAKELPLVGVVILARDEVEEGAKRDRLTGAAAFAALLANSGTPGLMAPGAFDQRLQERQNALLASIADAVEISRLRYASGPEGLAAAAREVAAVGAVDP